MAGDAAPDPLTPPSGAHHIAVPGGEAFIWMPHPGIVAQKAAGVLSVELARCFARFYDRLYRPGGRVRVFDDYQQLTVYTREARELSIRYTLDHLEALEALHILSTSKHLALGISSFKHQVEDAIVHTYSDRTSFLRSYEQAVREAHAGEPGPPALH
jgi:hypothetical protein